MIMRSLILGWTVLLAACGGPEFSSGEWREEDPIGDVTTSEAGASTSSETSGSTGSSGTGDSGGAPGPADSTATVSTTSNATGTASTPTTGSGGSGGTGAVSPCPEIAACSGQPTCEVTFAEQYNGCLTGSYVCGDTNGLLIEHEAVLHEFPCVDEQGNSSCSQALTDNGNFLAANCADSGAGGSGTGGATSTSNTSSTETSSTDTTASTTGGTTEPEVPNCKSCNGNSSFCYWHPTDFPDGICESCPQGWADCDGYGPEYDGWEGGPQFGCETRSTALNQWGQCGECGPDPSTCVCDVNGNCSGGW